MDFSVDLSGLGEAVSTSISSMTPIFLIPAGLIVAAAILSWGISMLKRFRATR
ncbi:MAG: hypothetical protein ACOC1K_06160 [Nanoarchaeota archaeon]